MLAFQNIPDVIKKMPKVEIHLHLEGAFTFDFLYNLVNKYGGDPEINCFDDLQNKFVFKDFPHFIETWIWKNNFFRKPEDFEESTYRTLKNLSYQNVIYTEAFFSPWDFVSNGLKMEEIAEATIAGIRKAENEFPIKCGLIADIVRDHGCESSMTRLLQTTPFLNRGIVGVGLGGNEKDFPPILFQDVFLEARRIGFRTTVHAGEAAGPESVWSALYDLQAERIGHGVRAIEDHKLVEYLNTKQIPLEVCITSNLKTKVFSSLAEHPFDKFYKEGLSVTINSDDPPMFGADITDEFFLLHDKLKYSYNDLKIITLNTIQVSFLNDLEKKYYSDIVTKYWSKFI
ncbi:MAG: adenosine deaminase [Melioribacteraceae bacterium]|nr:adenosine deaminase [Melioribacteraceae bacterium]